MLNFDDNVSMNTAFNTGAFLCSGGNIMVISWGMIGGIWGKKVFCAPIRESRFTKSFVDSTKTFTVCVPKSGDMKDAIKFCGTKSGRDFDKWQACNLEKVGAKSVDGFVVGGCDKYYECKVVGQFEMKDMDLSDVQKWYQNGDLHTLYVGEIVEEY